MITKEYDKKVPTVKQISIMEIGECIIFPIKMKGYVRVIISTYKIGTNKKFMTRACKDEKALKVYRVE